MALGTLTPRNPFALPDPGSIWDLVSRLGTPQPNTPDAAPAVAPMMMPAPEPTTPATGETWIDKLTTPRPSAWGEALRTLLLTMPFGVAIGKGAVQRGVPSMSLGQVLQPMLQQRANERLWGAFQKSGLIPEGIDTSAMQQAGVDPRTGMGLLSMFERTNRGVPMSSIPGMIEEMLPQGTPEERARLGALKVPAASVDDFLLKIAEGKTNAQSLRQEAQALGIDPSTIPDRVPTAVAATIRQRFSDIYRQRAEGARFEQQDKLQQQRFQQQMEMQNRGFAQQERLRAMTEGAIAARAAQTAQYTADRAAQQAAATDERSRRTAFEASYRNEARDFQSQLMQAKANRDKQLRMLDDPLTAGLSDPGEIQRKKLEVEAEYQATVGPYEDGRDLARIEQRRISMPAAAKQSRLTADELQAYLQKSAGDQERQRKLLAEVRKGLEENAIQGITPDEFIQIRRNWLGGTP